MEPLLQVKGITKRFPGVKALESVDFELMPGEVHAVVGENGAGKSTLMNILGGFYQPDEGEICFQGKKVKLKDPHSASLSGISVVYQELSLVPNLNVAENIFSNRQPVNRINFIKNKDMYAQTKEMLLKFDERNVQPQTLVKHLPVATQQVIEILKAMSYGPKVLILDEPTSSLTHTEIEKLFGNIRKLKQQGIAIIYISHHLKEIFELADRVTVLRDGKHVATKPTTQLTEDDVVKLMVGRELVDMYGKREDEGPSLEEVLRVEHLTRYGVFEDVSFTLRRGEILGFSGLVGAGRTEVGRTIFGADPCNKGKVTVNGKQLSPLSPKGAIDHGVGYLTENRKEQGLFLDMTIKDNLIAPKLEKYQDGFGFIRDKKVKEDADNYCARYRIATPGIWQMIGRLSGGNQQKVLLATWVAIRPDVLIIDEPTRGVDVGAKSEIYAHLRDLAKQGVGIIVISSDLPEVMGLSDRILVMRQGRIVGEIEKSKFSEETIIGYASGVSIKEEETV